MSRVLETILTGRNLLSPVLAQASRDVVAFNSTVAGAHEKAAAGATTSSRVQGSAADKIAASNVKASAAASASAEQQMRAHAKAAESATMQARVQQSANNALARSNGLLGTSLTPLTAGLGAVGLGLAYAGYSGMTFDKSMSAVAAASQATGRDLERLRQAALDAGADTQYSAEEAAQGITEMSKAGVSARDIMGGGLAGALNLAAAGQIEVAEAAETGATALSVFNLKGDQMSHVADLLAAGAGKAQGSVHDMSAALNQSALVAHQTGLSIEDTAGALAMFASNGLIGSDAGTSFKTMLQALTPNSEAASKAMDAIGFSAYDAQGHFVGMESVAAQLRKGLGGLTEEQRNSTLETIFGSDAVRAASVLYTEGAKGVAEWTANVNDAGYAAKQAAALNNNLAGDLERLGGSVKTFFTNLGAGTQGPLRDAVQGLNAVVGAGGDVLGFFTSLPGPVQAGLLAMAGWAIAGDRVMGILRPMGGALGPLRDGWSSFGEALNYARANGDGLGTVLQSVGSYAGGQTLTAVKALGRAIGPELAVAGAAFVVTGFIDGLQSLTQASDEAKAAADSLAQSLTLTDKAADRRNIRKTIEDTEGLVEALEKAGVSSEDATAGLLGQEAAQNRVRQALEAYLTTLGGHQGQGEAEDVRQVILAYDELATGYGTAASNARYFADSAAQTATSMTGVEGASGAAATGISTVGGAAGMAQEQVSALGQSLADFVDPLGAYTGLLDEKKEADRTAAEATAAATKSSKDSWEDYVTDVGVSFDEYEARLEEQVTAQANWQTNMLTLAGRVSAGTLAELSRMGPEGAPLVADLVNRSDAELAHMDDLFAARSQEATDAWGAQLSSAAPVLAAIGRVAGQDVVDELAAKLQAGTATVAGIAAQYGVELANGVNPVLQALGKRPISGLRGRLGGLNEYSDGGYTGPGGKYEPAGIVHKDEYVVTKERTARLGVRNLENLERILPGYANGGFVTAADVPRPPSTAPYGTPISTAGDAAMDTEYTAATAWMRENGPWGRALAWAQSQVGRPYVWGGVGPGGYDCSGFMSAITNVIRGRSPNSRVGSTASFPWVGFAPGNGEFTIGSTSDAGGGIGHMAGTLLGVNVESRGGEGVVVGPRARGASSGLFGTRAHLAMFNGGVIGEPVVGMGVQSGRSYSFAERGPEVVLPAAPAAMPGYGAGGAWGGGSPVVKVKAPDLRGLTIQGRVTVDGDGIATIAGRVVDQAFQEAHDQQLYNR